MKVNLAALMCPPTYYGIHWQDPTKNPWMDRNQQPDKRLAFKQWGQLVSLLQRLLGPKNIHFLSPQARPKPGLGDQVFTANVAGLLELRSGYKIFIKANFAPKERKPESEIAASWLWKHGYNVYRLPDHLIFEGQGDIITTQEAYLYCYGIRNSAEAMEEIERSFRLAKPVIYLRLTDPRFYHGDLAIRYSRYRNALLFYPGAFDEQSIRSIENLKAKKKEVEEKWLVQEIEKDGKMWGRNFLLNGCYIGKVETFPWNEAEGEFPRSIRNWVEAGGGEIVTIDFSQFGLSGAGHRCVTLFLN